MPRTSLTASDYGQVIVRNAAVWKNINISRRLINVRGKGLEVKGGWAERGDEGKE